MNDIKAILATPVWKDFAAAGTAAGKAVKDLAGFVELLVRDLSSSKGGSSSMEFAVKLLKDSFKSLRESAMSVLDVVGAGGLTKAFGGLVKSILVSIDAFRGLYDKDRAAREIGASIGKMFVELAKVPAKFLAVTAAAGVLIDGLSRLVGTFQQMFHVVELFSPGDFYLFQVAIRDTVATIGEILLPALKSVTEFVKMAGDALTGFSEDASRMIGALAVAAAAFMTTGPVGAIVAFLAVADKTGAVMEVIGQIMEVFVGLLDAVAEAFSGVIQAVTPVIKVLTEILAGAFKTLADILVSILDSVVLPLLTPFMVLLQLLADFLEWVKEILVDLGLVSDATRKRKDASVGKAAYQAQFMSAESFAQKAYASAFSVGAGMKKEDPAAKSAGFLKEIRDWMEDIHKWLDPLKVGGGAALKSGYTGEGDKPELTMMPGSWVRVTMWGLGREAAAVREWFK